MESFCSDTSKQEAVSLLEDGWFFGNLFNRKSRFTRCHSDPSYSSSSNGRVEMMELRSKGNNLRRTPSLPPCFGGEGMAEEEAATEEEEPRMADLIRQAMLCGRRLVKAPSLPRCRAREEGGGDRGGRIELNRRRSISLPGKGDRTSKLTRRASINSALDLPPRHSSKGMESDSSTRKSKQQRKQEVSTNKSESNSNMKHRDLNRSRLTKRISNFGHEEVEGFEDLGFTFEEDDLSISISSILSNLQVKDDIEEETDKVRRHYLSTTWIDKGSSDDIKAQIKIWAKIVASDIHSEY
ncbi:hypothetical protein Nepgr_007456 [Nepenthes gracilis]|uniref:Uncharacterized protein n=1 Tax=Nepenthes gracilis TaxID=150966 RepID=A0AAD3S7Q3_NEPGR|nr:hypothetical protein Nepgr_007456 [Nepenthes gracilis]